MAKYGSSFCIKEGRGGGTQGLENSQGMELYGSGVIKTVGHSCLNPFDKVKMIKVASI